MNEDAILSSLRWNDTEERRRDVIVGAVETVLTASIAVLVGAGMVKMLLTMLGA